MSLAFSLVNYSLKAFTRLLCRIDGQELDKVPMEGPLIVASNHINFIEVPIMYTHLQPRRLTGFAKEETWNNPILGLLFNIWGAIPLRRGEADTTAFRSAIEELRKGKILAVAPEGTRSHDGKLQSALPGVIMLAQMSKAPILPLVFFGSEKLSENIKRLKRTDFHIHVGRVFNLSFPEGKTDRATRKAMVDEIMYQLASLLPEDYRGAYADLTKLTTNYLNFV